MSKVKHHDAMLEGKDPRFPDGFRTLAARIEEIAGCNGHRLNKAALEVAGYGGQMYIKTSDGYNWFWGLEFTWNREKVVVAIPWSQNFDKSDGNSADRAIAVYADWKVPNTVLTEILLDLVRAL